MARFDTSGMDGLIADLNHMEQQTGPLAEAMTMAAAEIIKGCWQRSAEEHGLRDTGAMIESIGYPRAPTNFGDALGIDVYPQGKDSKGVRNAEKAFVQHYGTGRVPATYFVDDADAYSEEAVPDALQAIMDEYIDTGRIPSAASAAAAYAPKGTRKETIK